MKGILQATEIFAKAILLENQIHKADIRLRFQLFVRADKSILIGEMLLKKAYYQFTGGLVERFIDGHLPEEIFYPGIAQQHPGDTIPKIIHGKQRLGAGFRTLILRSDKRPSKFHGLREIFLDELVGKLEKMRCSHVRLAILLQSNVFAENITVSSDNGLCVGIPHNKLLIGFLHEIVLVQVH